jgi:predicted RNA-binding protein with PUA-like domain
MKGMAAWLLKTEPSTYSFGDLAKADRAVWDGVKNPTALQHLRAMKVGDRAVIYHTGEERAAVGLAKVASAPRPDPKNAKLTVVELAADARLGRPVTLAELKAEPLFKKSPLVTMGRLSVLPLDGAQWKRLLAMAGARR